MPSRKKTTRRSVSVRGLTHQRAKRVARRLWNDAKLDNPSVSGLFERLIKQEAERLGIPAETELEPREPANKSRPRDADIAASGVFTW